MPTSDPPRTRIATPSRISSPPSVTMNDGIFSRATSTPWMAPNAAQASKVTMIAAHHGKSAPVGCTSSATTTLLSAMTRPTDRSISPRSRAKISPIASSMYTVLCSKRLTRFCEDRNLPFAIWKTTATTTMARTTGRTPLLPPRTRPHQARKYWPSDRARARAGRRPRRPWRRGSGRPSRCPPSRSAWRRGPRSRGFPHCLSSPGRQTPVTLPAPRRDSTSISTATRSTPPGRMYSNGVASEPRLSRDTP